MSIPYGRQDISEEDIRAVCEVLWSDWLTQGPAIERFERIVAEYCGVRHAVAVCNATAALHISCLSLGLGPGDRLWTVPNTFVASANCGLYCGAEVDFVDIDPRSYNMDVGALSARLVQAEHSGRLPKVVVPVHFAGQSCDMAAIRVLADQYGFRVIEDASHAIGGRYRERPIGACEFSDVAVFSFHPVKIITTGEGGMVLTNRDDVADRLRLLRTHGITRDPAQMTLSAPHGPWYYEQVELGFNYRMTDIQAALGASQMSRLGAFVERRRSLANRYDQLLEGMPVIRPHQIPDAHSSWHLYVIQIADGWSSRAEVFRRLRDSGILVNVHYMPVHLQPHYRKLGFGTGQFTVSERYYERAISLPLFPALSDDQQTEVVQALKTALQ